MRFRSTRRALAFASLFVGLVAACDGDGSPDDGGLDASPARDATVHDAGGDAGPQPDAGPAPLFSARLANNLPGHAALEVCMWMSVEGTLVPPGVLLTSGDLVVPFRGVSSYIEDNPFFIAYDVVDFRVALYSAEDFPNRCPDDPDAADTLAPVLMDTIRGAELEEDGRYTILATGLARGTFGAEADALPALCGPSFDQPCDQEAGVDARLLIVRDDPSGPPPDKARLRVSSQVPNVPEGFDVCFDPDLVPNPSEQGRCDDANPEGEPTLLFSSVLYGTVTDYTVVDPLLPSDAPAPDVGGGIYLAPGGSDCPPFDALPEPLQRCYPTLAAFPSPPPSDNIRPHLSAGDVSTLFIAGAAGLEGADAPYAPSMVLWLDNLGPTP